ncbi:hypothetical protein HAX54_006274 [Datura stramonium]|uniref:Uncharacterized protein n=1 Tax=Datura stramonium TaxID=4076 RepID=A0ABS8TBF6_DATST|nr:hypothetical protein [Datura stramonium]
MTRDKILSSVLGERLGYLHGKRSGKKPPRKTQTQQVNIKASVSSVMEITRQEMKADMEQKLQEEREQMAFEFQINMKQEFQKKLEEEHERVRHGEVEKMIKRTDDCFHD